MTRQEAIVCVDDEPLVLYALRRELRSRLGTRFTIKIATNGAEALALIDKLDQEQTATRLVVSDAMMPVMDGYELIEQLHQQRPHVHAIMITGYGDDAKISQLSKTSGLVASFEKPWDSDVLCSLIEQTLHIEPTD